MQENIRNKEYFVYVTISVICGAMLGYLPAFYNIFINRTGYISLLIRKTSLSYAIWFMIINDLPVAIIGGLLGGIMCRFIYDRLNKRHESLKNIINEPDNPNIWPPPPTN